MRPSRIFFDSNVVISAIVFGGNELEAIIKSSRARHELFISQDVLEEASKVVLAKFPEHIDHIAQFIEYAMFDVIPEHKYLTSIDRFPEVRDFKDRHILAAASAANCDYVVTGDSDLLVLEYVPGIRLVNSVSLIKALNLRRK